jgi:hypothetical protein
LRGEGLDFVDEDGDGIPDILQDKYQQLPEPIIIAPRKPIPVEQIITYKREGHEQLFKLGYEDAKRAWRSVGRIVEGEG